MYTFQRKDSVMWELKVKGCVHVTHVMLFNHCVLLNCTDFQLQTPNKLLKSFSWIIINCITRTTISLLLCRRYSAVQLIYQKWNEKFYSLKSERNLMDLFTGGKKCKSELKATLGPLDSLAKSSVRNLWCNLLILVLSWMHLSNLWFAFVFIIWCRILNWK